MIAMDRGFTEDPCKDCEVPGGVPTWMTEEILCQTIRVWQPHYQEKLTKEDAVEILMAFSRLLDCIAT